MVARKSRKSNKFIFTIFFVFLLGLISAFFYLGDKYGFFQTEKKEELPIPKDYIEYDRDLYGDSWDDVDNDCQNTRHEVLIRDNLEKNALRFKRADKCLVQTGKWYCPYTNKYFNDATKLDVDHLVPVKEAHISGAWQWDTEKKVEYYNSLDPHHLIPVYLGANRSKGAKDPAEWRPENKEIWCDYAKWWRTVKSKWELDIDDAEENALQEMEATCSN